MMKQIFLAIGCMGYAWLARGQEEVRSFSQRPFYPQYILLYKALHELEVIKQNGGWLELNFSSRVLRLGDTGMHVRKLITRLKLGGDLSVASTATAFDDEVLRAVKQFQSRHGLTEDGVVGRATRKELNTSVDHRIKQVRINMDRCRWMPYDSLHPFVVVNIPAFHLQLMQGNNELFSCRVVVGKETNRTAEFRGWLKHLVFSPYWNIPDNIVRKEILPLISKDPGYLKRNNLEWRGGKLRQRPGPDNALGGVKFAFPNPYSMYLHDTPAKGLFREEQRTFSHGCIRVAAPDTLAHWLLRGQQGWDYEQIHEAMSRGKEQWVTLTTPTIIYVYYLTAFVDPGGRLHFRKDVYQRDQLD